MGHLDTLKKDFRGALFLMLDSTTLRIGQFITTVWVKLSMRLRGVEYGRGCQFYGRTFFRRYVQSTITIGDKCRFRSSFLSNYIGLNRPCLIATHRKNARIIIGEASGLSGTVIGAAESVVIGKNVLCGGNTLITDFDWHTLSRSGQSESMPVLIDDNVWLGANVTVLKGVRIGKNTVVGADSVVTQSLPDNVVAAGNPCRVIREIGIQEGSSV